MAAEGGSLGAEPKKIDLALFVGRIEHWLSGYVLDGVQVAETDLWSPKPTCGIPGSYLARNVQPTAIGGSGIESPDRAVVRRDTALSRYDGDVGLGHAGFGFGM
jgi:hypothetical protein